MRNEDCGKYNHDNSDTGRFVSEWYYELNKITYAGAVDGELQQQSIDEVNQYVSDAVGARKLKYSELENAIYIAMQNVAAGGDPETELQNVQAVSDGIER